MVHGKIHLCSWLNKNAGSSGGFNFRKQGGVCKNTKNNITMSTKDKLLKELKAILLVSLYFLVWFGTLMILKVLLLSEYSIEFYGASKVIVGALIVAKAVLILEHVPLGLNNKPAIVDILLRTFLYLAGVAVILILEHALEARHEYGGFLNALKNVTKSADIYHVLVTLICVFGALFFYNLGSVISGRLGKGIWEMMISPVQEQKK
jgi:hypothetical protein